MTPVHYRRSTIAYPFVGLIVGLLLAAAALGLFRRRPILLVALWAGLTGGLHLDGWMDSADALLSGQSRERMLEILKDSRSGAMGVIACFILLMCKIALLIVWFDAIRGETGQDESPWQATAWLGLIVIPVWSRWFMTAAAAHWPYARKQSNANGAGSLIQGVGKLHAGWAGLVAFGSSICASAVTFAGFPWEVALLYGGVFILSVIPGTWLVGSLAAHRVSRKLGGLTGDVYGALNEGLEVTLLFGLALMVSI